MLLLLKLKLGCAASKRQVVVAVCLWVLFAGGVWYCSAQSVMQQPPNQGFEQWSGEATSSPAGWHSYDEADGIFAGTASNSSGGDAPALQRAAGHTGKNAVVIRCNKILGIAANGALTCGRVHMGAMTASSDDNYCYTDRDGGYACRFTSRPDSVSFWAKFKMKGKVTASAKAHLHTDCDFRDFVDIGQSSDIASAIFYFSDAGNGGWHQYKQAFKAYASPQKATAEQAPMPTVDTWTRRPSYLLFSFTTNRHVMKGSKGDALYIDDIRFIYNKRLSQIMIDGEPLPDFSPGCHAYVCRRSAIGCPQVAAVTESPRATVAVHQPTADNPVAEIVVSHDDVLAGEAQPVIYRIYFQPVMTERMAQEGE